MPPRPAVDETSATQPCCALATSAVTDEDAARIAPMFKALGDPVRLRLASLIASRPEVCVCDLAGQFALAAPTISHHLKVLREAGLVHSERRGTWVYYSIRHDAIAKLSLLLSVTGPRQGVPRGGHLWAEGGPDEDVAHHSGPRHPPAGRPS